MYYRLSDIPSHLEDKFTVCYMGEVVKYIVFNSVEGFVKLYRKTPNKHFYEVIRNNYRKFIVDIDQHISNNDLLDIIDKVKSVTGSDVALFSSCTSIKTSYHIVAYEKYFTIDQCKSIVNMVDKKGYCDRSVYKTTQLFRIEGSTKYNEKRFKYLYDENKISDNPELFFAYCPIFDKPKKHHEMIEKHIGKNLIHLKRVSPGYCDLCKRVHDKENAYILNGVFHCFRYDNRF